MKITITLLLASLFLLTACTTVKRVGQELKKEGLYLPGGSISN